jgi:site-specific recombinase XerD
MSTRGPYWIPPSQLAAQAPLPIANWSNAELAKRFGEWLVAQRFSRSAHQAYTKVAFFFAYYMGERHLSAATHLDVRFYLVETMKRNLSVDGYNRHPYALRRFFDFLYMGGVVDAVTPRLVRGRRKPRSLPRVVAVSDIEKLTRAARTDRNKAIIELLYSTGCRVGELVGIHVEDVDFLRRTVRVVGKGKERTAFFCPRASRAIRLYLRDRKKGPLFQPQTEQVGCVHRDNGIWRAHWIDYSRTRSRPYRTSTYLSKENLTRRQAWNRYRKLVPKYKLECPPRQRRLRTTAIARVLKYAAMRAGLGRVTPHMIRHSFATHLLHGGVDVRHVQELLGHSSLLTTQVYTRVAPTELASIHRRFHPRR